MTSDRSQVARSSVVTLLLCVAACLSAPAAERERKRPMLQGTEALERAHSAEMPATGMLEVAFSPDEGSQALVIKVIDSARSDIRVLAYSFTSGPVTQALLRARHRGVQVALVVDAKNNTSEDRSGKARAALSALATAGADVRLISAYAIHHDKVVLVDRETVELGSFNFSSAAAHRNSENVLVNWHNPRLAGVYMEHFERNYRQSVPYESRY